MRKSLYQIKTSVVARLCCGSISRKQMGCNSGGCTRIGDPVRETLHLKACQGPVNLSGTVAWLRNPTCSKQSLLAPQSFPFWQFSLKANDLSRHFPFTLPLQTTCLMLPRVFLVGHRACSSNQHQVNTGRRKLRRTT